MTTSASPPLLAPVRLPQRLDGTRLDHLSASSLALFWRCPEAYRVRYLARVRGPESAELRRGWVVDAAIEAHFKALLATGEPLPQRDVEDIYAAAWQQKIDETAVEIDWAEDSPAHVKDTGLIALRAYLTELAPAVRPVSVQREFAFALAPELDWTLTGRLDLEDADGEVIDIKVKKRHVAQADADSDPQPSLYLLERALAGRPARRFLYHSVNPTAGGEAVDGLHAETSCTCGCGLRALGGRSGRMRVSAWARTEPSAPMAQTRAGALGALQKEPRDNGA